MIFVIEVMPMMGCAVNAALISVHPRPKCKERGSRASLEDMV